MNRTARFLLVGLLGLGASGVALAQDRNDNRDKDKDRGRERDHGNAAGDQTMRRPVAFVSSKWLLDRKVRNTNGEEVASVSDFILDRGSGYIDYAVVKTGTVLGLGGKKVAISYPELRWDTQGEHFLYAATVDELKQFPEFNADEWKAVVDTGQRDANAPNRPLRQRLMTDASSSARDPFGTGLAEGKKTRFQGEVIRVERNRLTDFGEHVFITVRGTDSVDHKVALGPSWYVNSAARAPMRGDQVTVTALELPRDPEKTAVATTLLINGEDVPLRSDDGTPQWALRAEDTANANKYNVTARRYVLASEINSAPLDCRGTACGKVDDSVYERNSALLTFLSIDPNQNFLGIGDTKRLVPWTVCTITPDRRVRIDASKEMILASPETPKELTMMNSGGLVELVYKAYDVQMPRFEPLRARTDTGGRSANDGWGRDGVVLRSIKKDVPRKFNGKYTKVEQVKFDDMDRDRDRDRNQPNRPERVEVVGTASGITMNADGQDVVVLLGPAWYMENQQIGCREGDPVVIEASRGTINGKEYWIARSIDCGGNRVVLVDNAGTPAWEREGNRNRDRDDRDRDRK